MQIQLSQKERMLLEDDKHQEEICVKKYESYSQQATDPELKQLFQDLAADEQHHYDMINDLLQGQEPDMSHSNMKSSQSGKSSSQSGMSQSTQGGLNPTASSQGTGKDTDEVLCSDLLSTEKFVSSTYDTGIFEAANSSVRQTLQHIQKEEQKHGEQLFNYMHSHGMYQVK